MHPLALVGLGDQELSHAHRRLIPKKRSPPLKKTIITQEQHSEEACINPVEGKCDFHVAAEAEGGIYRRRWLHTRLY